MSMGNFPYKKALQIFGTSPEGIRARQIDESTLPDFARGADNRLLKSWSFLEMPSVGERVGFLNKLEHPIAAAIFVTKGGVLKSSLTLNLARMAALHGVRTCVVGLDMQGDVTTSLGDEYLEEDPTENTSLADAVAKLEGRRGLADLFAGDAKLADLIKPTDLPTLSYIPETAELVALDQSLVNRNRREYWLRDFVIEPLKRDFDLILMDCSPNWNRLITNALVSCDVLLAPLECKINNFRNFKAFRQLLNEFQSDMASSFKTVFIPTRLSPARKLSQEIFAWYQTHLPECTQGAIRESVQGEESIAMRLSVTEHAPTSAAAEEMRQLAKEVWQKISEASHQAVPRRTPSRDTELSH